MKFIFAIATATSLCALAAPAMATDLLTNGGFEASSDPTMTPPGWTNIGHSDGVISYALFGTPPYQGNYYYDFGGFGDASGPAGDGLEQSVVTSIGSSYTLNFGLSSENDSGTSVLEVYFNNSLFATYNQGIDGSGDFHKPFVTQSLSYVATSNSTTIKFLEGVGTGLGNGNNDPLIDGVSFNSATSPAPEPASWAMFIGGFGLIGGALRSRRKVAVSFG